MRRTQTAEESSHEARLIPTPVLSRTEQADPTLRA